MRSRWLPHDSRSALLLCGVLVCTLLACAPSSVARRIESVALVAEQAARRGAKVCAPEELALARVHLEFARLELRQGEVGLADRHLTLAEPNAKAALRLSNASDECAHATHLDSPLAGPRARFDSTHRAPARLDITSSRLLGAVGESRDLGRGAP